MDIYQLKVTLIQSDPPIWRRLQVRGDSTLGQLHRVLQVAMGWRDRHLHQFTIGGREYGRPDRDDWFELGEMIDENRVKLADLVKDTGAQFIYEYDFADSWEHVVLVEAMLPLAPGQRYPRCLAGERACPPEECGGIRGYHKMLEEVRNPDDPEHEYTLAWLGSDFDPEAFDLERVNQELVPPREFESLSPP